MGGSLETNPIREGAGGIEGRDKYIHRKPPPPSLPALIKITYSDIN
jgi:hypothetical protein